MLQLIINNADQATKKLLVPWAMSYSEAAYFHGYHYQHISDWEEHKRLSRIKRQIRQSLNNLRRRTIR